MIAVCGEALIDMIHKADGTRRMQSGGGPFNTARALARLGVPTSFVGRLSNDELGRDLARALTSDGVSLELASIGSEPTTIAVAAVDSQGHAEYQFRVEGTSAPNLAPEMLSRPFAPDVQALHVGSLGMVLEPIASTLLELLHRESAGRVVMLDPNIRPGLAPDSEYRGRLLEVVAQSTIVKASEADLGWLYPGLTWEKAAGKLVDGGVALAVCTLGREGAFGVHGDLRVKVDAFPVEVVDTIGAGDTFGAALLAWLHDHDELKPHPKLSEDELAAALTYACRAAAITCSRAGADPPWTREMM